MTQPNKITVEREFRGRTLVVRAEYSEDLGDWNVVLFEGGSAKAAKVTTDAWLEIESMLALEFKQYA